MTAYVNGVVETLKLAPLIHVSKVSDGAALFSGRSYGASSWLAVEVLLDAEL